MPIFSARKCLEERDFGWVVFVLYSLVRKGHKTKQKEAIGDYSFLNLYLKWEVLAAKSMQKILKILRAYENLSIKTTIVCCVWLAAERCREWQTQFFAVFTRGTQVLYQRF